jgi:FKBP-type peptidyl-prolyl cis-trans isomerase FkpA
MRLPFFLTILVGAVLAAVACSSPTESGASGVTTLQMTDITVGTGTVATSGKSVTVHYTGWLYNTGTADHHGSKFDSSRDRGQPFTFVLGTGQVIAGWDQGVAGMKVGGQRTLVIPPSLAYGDRSPGSGIPPNATLVFDIELLDVK